MRATLFLVTSLLLLGAAEVSAHTSTIAHPPTSNGIIHSLMHFAVLIPVGVVAFLLSRYLLRRRQH